MDTQMKCRESGRVTIAQRRQRPRSASLLLILVLALSVFGRPDDLQDALVLSGEAWLRGTLRGLSYSTSAGGIVLVPGSVPAQWSMEFTDVFVKGVLVDPSGRVYATGSQRVGGRWEAWLAAVNRDGTLAWQTSGLASPGREWSHGLALDSHPGGGVVVVGYAGGSLWVSTFASSSRVLWEVRLPAQERSLGQDVVVRGDSVYVAATYLSDEGSVGAVLCFHAAGTLLWKEEIEGSTELRELAWHDGELIALWRGQDRWSVSGLSPEGNLRWTLDCPATFSPAALAIGPRSPVLVGVEVGEHLFAPRTSVLEIVPGPRIEPAAPHVRAGFAPRAAAGGLGVLGVLGSADARTVLVLWDAGLQQALEESLSWHPEAQAQALASGSVGQWAATGSVNLAGSTSSRVELRAPARDLRDGEYVSPTWTVSPSSPPQTLVIRTGGLDTGQVTAVLETSDDGFLTVSSRLEWQIREEEERLPLDSFSWGPSIRVRLVLRGTEPGSPVVREVTLEMGIPTAPVSPPVTTPPPIPAEPTPIVEAPELPPVVEEPAPAEHVVQVPAAAAVPSVGQIRVTAFSFSLPPDSASEEAWTWDFGDGATGSTDPSVHVYTQPGRYTVRAVSERGEVLGAADVAVYRCVTAEFALPFQLPGGRLAAGDFDGDRLVDLAVWSDSSAAVHLYLGREGGRFVFRGTVELPYPPVWVQVTDLDGDGFDDLVFGSATGTAEIGYLRGGSSLPLGPARVLSVPLRIAHPIDAEPDWPGILLAGTDPTGQRAILWLRSEGGQVHSTSHAIPGGNPTMISLNLDASGTFQQVFFGPSRGWLVPSAPRPFNATLISGEVLGAGQLDGDPHPDALVRSSDRVAVWGPATESMITLAPWSPRDTWQIGDLGGLATSQAIRIDPSGSVRIHFLGPFSGEVAFSLPFVPADTVMAQLVQGDPAVIIAMSHAGQAAWIALTTR